MKNRSKGGLGWWLSGSLVGLALLIVVAIALGSVWIPPSQVLSVLANEIFGAHFPSSSTNVEIIWSLRAPRVFAAALVGAMLALAGTALQGLVRNPLADPYIIGVSSGASVGAAAVMVLGSSALAGLSVSGAAFAGAISCIILAYFFAQKSGHFTDSRIILGGVAISYVAMAITSYLELTANPGELKGLLFWTMGSVAGVSWSSLLLPVIVLLIGGFWLISRGSVLNALALGDDDAISLGVNVKRIRLGLLVSSAALTALAVCVAGGVGFVGLIIPHACRMIIGHDNRKVLPLSGLFGAIFLVFVDLIARTLWSPNEFPLTIFTAAIGGPFFIWLMTREKSMQP